MLFVIFLGILGGVAVGLQNPLTSMISQRLGVMESVFIIHIGGAIAIAAPLIAMRGGALSQWRDVPWYALAGGVLGIVVLSAISYTIPRIGVAVTLILIITGQMVLSVLLDHFGWLGVAVRPLDPIRILGILVVFVGTWLIVR